MYASPAYMWKKERRNAYTPSNVSNVSFVRWTLPPKTKLFLCSIRSPLCLSLSLSFSISKAKLPVRFRSILFLLSLALCFFFSLCIHSWSSSSDWLLARRQNPNSTWKMDERKENPDNSYDLINVYIVIGLINFNLPTAMYNNKYALLFCSALYLGCCFSIVMEYTYYYQMHEFKILLLFCVLLKQLHLYINKYNALSIKNNPTGLYRYSHYILYLLYYY